MGDLLYSCGCGLLEVFLQFLFLGRFEGKRAPGRKPIPFFLLGGALVLFALPVAVKLAGLFVLLTLYGIYALGAEKKAAALDALLILAVMQLCYGAVDALCIISTPVLYRLRPVWFGRVYMVAGELLALGLTALQYELLTRQIGRKGERWTPLAVFPLLLVFAVGGYACHTFYGTAVTLSASGFPLGRGHVQMLAVQLLGLTSTFCFLQAGQRLADRALLRTELSLSRQYAQQAGRRYQDTRALRHDMKNHLLVLRGLMEKGELARAAGYLDQLEAAAVDLSFPFHTNRPVLDVLLEEKAAAARRGGIAFHSTLQALDLCPASDMDLCCILSNALDNALHASLAAGREKDICLTSRRQGEFWLLEIENSFDGGSFQPGTGLSNIRRVAERYRGALEIHAAGGRFTLRVLLSQQNGRSSHPTRCTAREEPLEWGQLRKKEESGNDHTGSGRQRPEPGGAPPDGAGAPERGGSPADHPGL